MSVSRSFSNFAKLSCIVLLIVILMSCKGRTLQNIEPTGDTIEVVIMQDQNPDEETNQQLNLE